MTAAPGALGRRRAAVVLGAAAAPSLIWLVADPLLGRRLRITEEGGGDAPQTLEIGAFPVVALALAVALGAWALLAALERFAVRRARTVWLAVALAVLALSALPLTGSGMSHGTRVALALMHLAVAAVLLPGLGGPRAGAPAASRPAAPAPVSPSR